MAWFDNYNFAGNSNGGGLTGTTLAQVIPSSGLSNTGKLKIRVTFVASLTEAFTISKAYIQQAAGSGDPYDFSTTPVQITFNSGNAGFAIASGANIVSDEITYSVPNANLVIAYYVSGDATHDGMRSETGHTGFNAYWRAGDEAATVNKTTGYTALTAGSTYGCLRLESFSAEGGYWFEFFRG